MAYAPCYVCRRRITGKAARAYIAIMDGTERWEHKPRLCRDDFERVSDLFHACGGDLVDEGEEMVDFPRCLVCQGDVDGTRPHSIFMTGYDTTGQRVDYFAPCCSSHRGPAEKLLLAPPQRA